MGPASLKTSPPIGVSLVRKRVEALQRKFKRKERKVGLHLYFL
jgi:hypothetical protein